MFSYAKNIARHTFKSDVLEAHDNKLDVVDFWAGWCVPCKTMEPLLEKMARKYEYKIDVYKINIEDEPETAKSFNISSIPTLIFFKNGKRVATHIGVLTEQNLESEILKNI